MSASRLRILTANVSSTKLILTADMQIYLAKDGQRSGPLPLAERKRMLGELLREDTGPLYKVLTLEEDGRALFSAIRKMDLEGMVAKRKNDQYSATTPWYRIKNPGFSQGEGRVDLFRPRERRR